MDCCGYGHVLTPRSSMWGAALAPAGAMLAGAIGPRGSTGAAHAAETVSAALDVLRNSISVDVHTHGGKTGITSKAPPNDDLANAAPLAGQTDRASGSNVYATIEPGEYPLYDGVGSVWYRWTAPVSGKVTLDTSGSNFAQRASSAALLPAVAVARSGWAFSNQSNTG